MLGNYNISGRFGMLTGEELMTYRRVKVSSRSWPSGAENFVLVVHCIEVTVSSYVPVDTAEHPRTLNVMNTDRNFKVYNEFVKYCVLQCYL